MDNEQFKNALQRLFDYDARIDEAIYTKHPEWESDVQSLQSQWRFEAAQLLVDMAKEIGVIEG